MQENFTQGQLRKWASNFRNNEQLPFITESALIELKDLESFIAKIKDDKDPADCIRIYFVRFEPNDTPTPKVMVNGELAEGCKWVEKNGLTQATIAIVPAKKFRRDENLIFSADDIIVNNRVWTLMPGVEKEGTALNPPPPSTESTPAP